MGLYVDDTYRLARATVNWGVRYDYSKGSFPSLPMLNAQGLPTGEMSAANDDVYHWHTVSPRVGVNYRVNASGTTLLKAHYGRYYKALEAGGVPAGGAVDHPGLQLHARSGRQPHQLRADLQQRQPADRSGLQVGVQRSVHRAARAGSDEGPRRCR